MTLNANLGLYRNKILFVPSEVASTGDFGGDGVMNIIGHSINMRAGYIADGIFKSQEEVDNHADQTGKGIGRIRYKDLDNNGVIDTKDQTWIGDPNPDFTYGLNIYLEYKNFDLTMFWPRRTRRRCLQRSEEEYRLLVGRRHERPTAEPACWVHGHRRIRTRTFPPSALKT